jgi:hypothetical protein
MFGQRLIGPPAQPQRRPEVAADVEPIRREPLRHAERIDRLVQPPRRDQRVGEAEVRLHRRRLGNRRARDTHRSRRQVVSLSQE